MGTIKDSESLVLTQLPIYVPNDFLKIVIRVVGNNF